MRKLLLVLVTLSVLAAGGALLGLRLGPPPAVPDRAAVATAALPPAPAAPGTAVAPAEERLAEAAPAAPSRAAAALTELPRVEVPERPVHAVPNSAPMPPQPVTLKGRDGRDIAPRSAQLAARLPPPPLPGGTPALIISGPAHVGDAVSLMVGGRAVAFFGVRAPQAGDRCGIGAALAPRGCGEVAREALAQRLRGNAAVSCRVPPGQRGGAQGAVCLDAAGVDLGGFLVGEGFALADPAQSYDYAGAERIARSSRRGLWRYR